MESESNPPVSVESGTVGTGTVGTGTVGTGTVGTGALPIKPRFWGLDSRGAPA